MSDMLDAALAYQERGWSVIPISPSSKTPLVSWTEYQNRIATPQEINEWWRKNPNANIGIVTGRVSNLVVIDIDSRKGATPHGIVAQNPSNFIAKTGGGGFHLYYSRPDAENVPNRVDKSGIDIRGDGGYVVAPPSIHPSGTQYDWLKAGDDYPLTQAPAFVVNGRPSDIKTATKDEMWLTEAMQGVGYGARNDIAARLTGYYISKKMPRDVILNILENWNEKNTPPLPLSELQTTVDSVFKTSYRREDPTKSQPVRRLAQGSKETFALVGMSDYMIQHGGTSISWMVDDWLPESTIAMSVAPPGTYKTWLLLDLALSVATGAPFLGKYPVRNKGPVILIQQEDFHGQIAERIGVISHSRFDWVIKAKDDNYTITIPNKPQIYIHPDRRLRFADSVVMEALADKVEAIRPVLVIIDPLYSTGETDDYMARTVEHMFLLKDLRDMYGTTFFIAHHTSKGKDDTRREDAWGSQFLNAFIETGWQIRPKSKMGTASIRRHFKVKEDTPEAILKFEISTVDPYKYHTTLIESRDEKDTKAIDLVTFLSDEGPKSPTQIAEATGLHRSTISRRLVKLTQAGIIQEGPGKTYKISDLSVG